MMLDHPVCACVWICVLLHWYRSRHSCDWLAVASMRTTTLEAPLNEYTCEISWCVPEWWSAQGVVHIRLCSNEQAHITTNCCAWIRPYVSCRLTRKPPSYLVRSWTWFWDLMVCQNCVLCCIVLLVCELRHRVNQKNSTKESPKGNQSKRKENIVDKFRMLECQHLHGKHCRSYKPKHEDSAACTAHNCHNTTR